MTSPPTPLPGTLSNRINELYHDLQAPQFERLHQRRHRIERRFWLSQVLPRVRAMSQANGVDLCTGTGFVPGLLLENLGVSFTITCLDISQEALCRTAASLHRFAGRFTVRQANAAQVPLGDASADWVSVNAALHHLPDVPAAMKEVDRILKPGGYFFVGYEPNERFFRRRPLAVMERVLWRLAWYASPRNNWRRLGKALGRRAPLDVGEDGYLRAINETLLREGRLAEPLTLQQLRQHVDVHSQPQDHGAMGLDPLGLLSDCFLKYQCESLVCSDYGGESLRPHTWLRAAIDGVMRRAAPTSGMLFSWVIRKPMNPADVAATDGETRKR